MNANTAKRLADDPSKHPKLLTDFRAWLALVMKSLAWCTLSALDAKRNPENLATSSFLLELTHHPESANPYRKFNLKDYSIQPRSLVAKYVASDSDIAREYDKMSGKATVAALIVKAGALVKVVGFDASYDALSAHTHSDEWSLILEKSLKGEVRL